MRRARNPAVEMGVTKRMQPTFRPGTRWLLAFVCGCFAVSELHEQCHIQTGWLLYGGYGPRDFNVWQTARTDAYTWLATLAGPLFSYACMWMGYALSRRRPGPGIALLFAGLPFARLLTAALGGGDEKVLLLRLSGSDSLSPLLRAALLAAVALLALTPIVLAGCRLGRDYWRRLPLLLLLPLLLEFPLTHGLYNHWLQRGLGNTVFFGGTPLLIQVHLLLMVALVWWQRKALDLPAPAGSQEKVKAALRTTFTPELIN